MEAKSLADYEALGFDEIQMNEIRLGLEAGVDVSPYTDIKYNGLQMSIIRYGLLTDLDVSLYTDSAFTVFAVKPLALAMGI